MQLSILRLMDAQPVVEVRNPLGWWRTIIAVTAMDQLRASTRRREQEREAGEIHRLESLFFVSDFVSRIEHAELVKRIHREIDRLDERFRGPLLKRYFEDLSYTEIARALSLSPGTVASRLSRGIGQVRDALEAQGLLPVYQATEEETAMKSLPRATVDANRAFAEKWNDIWLVTLPKGARGIGCFTATAEPDGSVTLKCRYDIAYDKNNPRKDRPEEADARSWMSSELALQDVERFAWSRYRNEEAWINCWHEGDAYIGWSDVIEPDGNGGFVVTRDDGELMALPREARTPIVPDFLCFLVACEQERDRSRHVGHGDPWLRPFANGSQVGCARGARPLCGAQGTADRLESHLRDRCHGIRRTHILDLGGRRWLPTWARRREGVFPCRAGRGVGAEDARVGRPPAIFPPRIGDGLVRSRIGFTDTIATKRAPVAHAIRSSLRRQKPHHKSKDSIRQAGNNCAPPSIRSTCPVMYEESSVTRNSTVLATSSGQP